MNQSIRNNNRNLLNLFLVALIIFMTFGCSGFMDGFSKGYKESTEKSNVNTEKSNANTTGNSNSTETASTPNTPDKTETSGKLADKIIGKWEMSNGGKKTVFEFGEDKTLQTFVDNKPTTNGTYSIIDEKTIETKTPDGSITETIPVKIEGTKMTLNFNNTDLIFTKK